MRVGIGKEGQFEPSLYTPNAVGAVFDVAETFDRGCFDAIETFDEGCSDTVETFDGGCSDGELCGG